MIKQNEKCGTQEIYAWKSFNIFNKITYYEKRGTQIYTLQTFNKKNYLN